MRLLIIFICLLCTAQAPAEIYKTVDKNGNVIYTDNPPTDDAQAVKLREINTLPPQETSASDEPAPSTPQATVNYQVDIISPRNEVVIPPGERDLAVAVSISPGLHPDHLITYYLDGDLIEETQSSSIVIQDVPRGSRALSIEVIDQQGEVLGRSDPITVNVIRPIKKPTR